MPEPDIVRVVREQKEALAERDAATVAEMVRRWRQVEVATQRELDKILAEITRRTAAGEIVTREMIYQMERYQAMLAQVQSEVRQYQDYAERTIERVQRDAIDQGIADAIAAIQASGSPLAANFARMNPEAMRTIVGLCEDGSPLFDVLERRALYPESVQGLTDALVEGVTLGWNPRRTANSMMDGLADGLNKALVIARTEQMRAYRMASVAQYRASGVVSKFKRLSAKTDRTCLACLMEDGQVLELEEELYDHPNGLCAAVPWVTGMPEPEWETGKEWFEGLDADRQREMMGDAKYEAWQEGKFTLDQLVKTTDNPTWGKSLQPASLAELGIAPRVGREAAIVAPRAEMLTAAETRGRIDRVEAEYTDREARLSMDRRAVLADMEKIVDLVESPDDPRMVTLFNRDQDLLASIRSLDDDRSMALRKLISVDSPVRITPSITGKDAVNITGDRRKQIDVGIDAFSKLVSRRDADGQSVIIRSTKTPRSYAVDKVLFLSGNNKRDSTVVHEMGHWLEAISPEVKRAALDFYNRRTKGEPLKSLGPSYDANERTRADNFIDPYMGKDYKGKATEIISMGAEFLFRDPLTFARQDPEYFDFMYNLLRGR